MFFVYCGWDSAHLEWSGCLWWYSCGLVVVVLLWWYASSYLLVVVLFCVVYTVCRGCRLFVGLRICGGKLACYLCVFVEVVLKLQKPVTAYE